MELSTVETTKQLEKKPYHSPSLRACGSVREQTQTTGTMGTGDAMYATAQPS